MWNTLRHPNVVPLLGVSMDKNHFAMVSEWMMNGNINEFVKMHREANRFELVWFASSRLLKLLLTSTPNSSKMSLWG